MTKTFKTRRGLDIRLAGRAQERQLAVERATEIALSPSGFQGLVPKVVVKPGDHVLAGDPLFVNKVVPEQTFASPVSGEVVAVERGERRKVLAVRVKADKEQQYVDFGKADPKALSADEVVALITRAGLSGYIDQLPYAVATTPDERPRDIFVSALRDKPLQADFEVELQGEEAAWQLGLTALSRIATTHLGIGAHQQAKVLREAQDVDINVFDGPCPAGNVGVQVNHVAPMRKGDVVWTVDPTVVLFIGRLFATGRVDLRRRVAVAGTRMSETGYVEVLVGTPLHNIIGTRVSDAATARIIMGNPLTGVKATMDTPLGAHVSEITAIPEGDDCHEMLGWIMPRTSQLSTSRSYFSWLCPKKEYNLDARIKGGERHIIMSGEYDRMMPMDIMPEQLIKAIIAGDIDRQEQLGIYEVSPEDFALAEFADSSKLELQKIVRQGLDTLRKENA